MTTREINEYRGDVAMALRDRGYTYLADSVGGLADEIMEGYAVHYDEDELVNHLIFMDEEAERNDALDRLSVAMRPPNAPKPDRHGVIWIARDDERYHGGNRAQMLIDRANVETIKEIAPALATGNGEAFIDTNDADSATIDVAVDIIERLSAYPILEERVYARLEVEEYRDSLPTIASDVADCIDSYFGDTTPDSILEAARDAVRDALHLTSVIESTYDFHVGRYGPSYDADDIASYVAPMMLSAATYECGVDGIHNVRYSWAKAPANATTYKGESGYFAVMPYRDEADAALALYSAWSDILGGTR